MPETEKISQFEKIKNRVINFIDFVRLKQKEYSGEISFEELSEVLAAEFAEFQNSNPQLNEEFDPKVQFELVKKTPKEVRKKALDEFKTKFETQKLALAECRVYLERLIRQNPDLKREFLDATIEKFARGYGFSQNQKQIFKDLLDKYQEKRSEIIDLKEKFPNKYDLLNYLTGLNFGPQDNFEIFFDPMSITFKASGEVAYKISHGIENKKGKNFWNGEIGGFHKILKEISVIVIPIITSDEFKTIHSIATRRIHRHEMEHAKNSMLHEYFFGFNSLKSNVLKYRDVEFDDESKISSYLNDVYPYVLTRARDEFISYIIQGKNVSQKIFSRNYIYDYLGTLGLYPDAPYSILGDVWRKKITELEVRYQDTIKKSIAAFYLLRKDAKLNSEVAVALLTDKEFSRWPIEVKRIIEFSRSSKR